MNKKYIPAVLLLLVASFSLFTGCSTVQRRAAIGGSAGALIGGVLAGTQSHEVTILEGVVMGGGTGGLIGALLGDNFDRKSLEELELENENLKMQLEEKQRELEKMSGVDPEELTGLRAEIDRLKKMLQAKEAELAAAMKRIEDLEKQIAAMQPKEYTVTLAASVLFESNKAVLSQKGKETLKGMAALIKKRFPDKYINVEGHTDQDVISSGWKSNWELGAARALSVVHFLINDAGMDPAKLSASSFSSYRPIADNKTEAGKAENRRAVIVILSDAPIKRIEMAK